MLEVSREHDEVGLDPQIVDRRDRLVQRAAGVGIHGRSLEPPVRIRELDEVEVFLRRAAGCGAAREPGDEHRAAQTGELQEIPAIDLALHGTLLQ